jgi:glycosyltransferase involved in cell wall biosynthesis
LVSSKLAPRYGLGVGLLFRHSALLRARARYPGQVTVADKQKMMMNSEDSRKPRLRVLLSAFACGPNKGSEHGVGWNVAIRLASYHDVTVLYGDVREGQSSRQAIDAWIAHHGPIPGLTFRYVPPTPRIVLWERLHRIPGFWFAYYRAYNLWQREALKVAISLHRCQAFDLTHMLTYVSFREPGYLWKLNIPFFWGPIGGADNVPFAFWHGLALSENGRAVSRDILNRLHVNLAFRSKRAARKARLVWGASHEDLTLIQNKWAAQGAHLLETGTVPHHMASPVQKDGHGLRMMWSGLHVARKALPLLLHAIHQLGDETDWTLTILGSGPCTHKWQQLAKTLRLNDSRIRWLGHLPHEQAVQELLKADVLVHTSVKEGSTTVLMEALSLGRPAICHDIGGMSYVIDSTCGFKVPLLSPKVSIRGFKDSISTLVSTPGMLGQLSRGASLKAKTLTWDKMVSVISDAYISK